MRTVAAVLVLSALAAVGGLGARAVLLARPAEPAAKIEASGPTVQSSVLQAFEWGGSRRSLRWRDDDEEESARWRRSFDRERERARRWRSDDDDDDEDDDDDGDRSNRRYSHPAPERTYSARTYRTMCVRLCDGYAFPVSYATSPRRFEHDALACTSACDAPAKLYVYRNPGDDLENAVDLRGRPYTELPTAFRFRTTYAEACTCRPQPWSPVVAERQRVFALEAAAAKAKGADRVEQKKAAAAARETYDEHADAARAEVAASAKQSYEAVAGAPAPVVSDADRRVRSGLFTSAQPEPSRAPDPRVARERSAPEWAGGGGNAEGRLNPVRPRSLDWLSKVFGD